MPGGIEPRPLFSLKPGGNPLKKTTSLVRSGACFFLLMAVTSAEADRGGGGFGGHGGHAWGGHAGGGHWGGQGWHGPAGWRGGYGYYHGPRRYSNFGFYFGGTALGWPYYYPPPFYPYYYPPPVVTVPSEPPVYIERGDIQSTQGVPGGVWHFCVETKGYYPNVQECTGGWTEIPQVPVQQEPGFWYRCANPEGYYPYVRECPGGWVRITPQNAPSGPVDEE